MNTHTYKIHKPSYFQRKFTRFLRPASIRRQRRQRAVCPRRAHFDATTPTPASDSRRVDPMSRSTRRVRCNTALAAVSSSRSSSLKSKSMMSMMAHRRRRRRVSDVERAPPPVIWRRARPTLTTCQTRQCACESSRRRHQCRP